MYSIKVWSSSFIALSISNFDCNVHIFCTVVMQYISFIQIGPFVDKFSFFQAARDFKFPQRFDF